MVNTAPPPPAPDSGRGLTDLPGGVHSRARGITPDIGAGSAVTRVTGCDPGDQDRREWKGRIADSIDAWAEEAVELCLQGPWSL